MSRSLLSKAIAALEPSATEEVDNTVKRLIQRGVNDIVSLGVGEPCFDTPDNIKKAACDALWAGDTKYQPTQGSPELREWICRKWEKENGIRVSADDVIVTAGGKFAIYLAFQAVLEAGDQVMLLDPAWVTYESAAQMAGAGVIRIPTDAANGFQPDLERIRKAMTPHVKIVVLNSPCNPSGAVFEKRAIREITELAAGNRALVLSDEVYECQAYDCETYSPASDYDHVITVNAFSKSHAMTGWRLGYATGPREVLEGMIKIYQHSTSCVTSFAQAGGVEALRSEASCRASLAMTEGYRQRRDLMVTLIREADYLELPVVPQGAFYCFPSYRLEMGSVELAKTLLEEVHVATIPGAAFGACGEGHMRLSYATTFDAIREGFARMGDFFHGRCK